MNRQDLIDLFSKTAAEVTEREFPPIVETTVISELGIDSLGMLEIIGSLERDLKIHIPDENLATISTIKQLIDAVEARRAAAST
jgi:acyl carrier protein